jgi:hypothetical protein
MASFKETVAATKLKIAKAEAAAFMARMEAIDAIFAGASPDDIMLLCSNALMNALPLCCNQHLEKFKEEFLRMLDSCVAMARQDEAEADAPPQVLRTHMSIWQTSAASWTA